MARHQRKAGLPRAPFRTVVKPSGSSSTIETVHAAGTVNCVTSRAARRAAPAGARGEAGQNVTRGAAEHAKNGTGGGQPRPRAPTARCRRNRPRPCATRARGCPAATRPSWSGSPWRSCTWAGRGTNRAVRRGREWAAARGSHPSSSGCAASGAAHAVTRRDAPLSTRRLACAGPRCSQRAHTSGRAPHASTLAPHARAARAHSLTGLATRRSELPSRSTGFTAEPSTLL